jgi:hypothetical protein
MPMDVALLTSQRPADVLKILRSEHPRRRPACHPRQNLREARD